jgi:hypothetical protein
MLFIVITGSLFLFAGSVTMVVVSVRNFCGPGSAVVRRRDSQQFEHESDAYAPLFMPGDTPANTNISPLVRGVEI